jgi:hypothetical protein
VSLHTRAATALLTAHEIVFAIDVPIGKLLLKIFGELMRDASLMHRIFQQKRVIFNQNAKGNPKSPPDFRVANVAKPSELPTVHLSKIEPMLRRLS